MGTVPSAARVTFLFSGLTSGAKRTVADFFTAPDARGTDGLRGVVVSCGRDGSSADGGFSEDAETYTLFAGLLIAWDLIGLRLPQKGPLAQAAAHPHPKLVPESGLEPLT